VKEWYASISHSQTSRNCDGGKDEILAEFIKYANTSAYFYLSNLLEFLANLKVEFYDATNFSKRSARNNPQFPPWSSDSQRSARNNPQFPPWSSDSQYSPGGSPVFHLEFLVIHRAFNKSLTKHALEFTNLCVMQFRLVVDLESG